MQDEDLEVVWRKYQHWYCEHKDAHANISVLEGILASGDFSNIRDNGTDEEKRTCITLLIQQNDDHIKKCDRKMNSLGKTLSDNGISVDKFHADEALEEAKHHSNDEWRTKCDDYLNKKRPCKRKVDNTTVYVPFGASGFTGSNIEDDQDQVDVLVDDDAASVTSEFNGVAKINYYAEEDDANDVDEAYKSNDVAIKIGKSFITADLAVLLKPHQREAVISVLKQLGSNEDGVILAHAMGLGKSLTAIASLQGMSRGFKNAKMLILCPKSLTNSWFMEFTKWDEHLTISYYPPVEDDRMDMIKHWGKKGGVLIITHNRFRRYQLNGTFKFNPDIIVIDEAHNLKNKNNLFYKAVESVETRRKLLLTGTPLQNHLMEYFAMINLVSPSLFTEEMFKSEYASIIDKGAMGDASDEQITQAKTKIKVLTRLTENFVHRRSVAVLSHALPPMTDLKLTYELSDPPDMSGLGGLAQTYAIAKAAKKVKIDLAKKLIKAIRKTGDLTLIFSKSVEVIESISKKMGGMLMMTGKTDANTRKKLVDDFMNQTSGHTEFCMTTQVGGLGLNLQRANRIIILDPMWNPVIDKQACFRAYRYGQTKPVFIYRFIVSDSIEERIYRCAVHKSLAACRIIDDQDVERLFTKEQLSTKEEFEENIVDYASIQDPVLSDIETDFKQISQHDVLFAEANHEKLSEEELADAENEYNQIIYKNDYRVLTHPISQLQMSISMDTIYYPQNDPKDQIHLVAPAVPVWKRERAKQYGILSLNPKHSDIKKYILEFDRGKNGVFVESLSRKENKDFFYNQYKNGTRRVRAKIVVDDLESEWSEWSALMFS